MPGKTPLTDPAKNIPAIKLGIDMVRYLEIPTRKPSKK